MNRGSPHLIQAALGTAWALQPQRLAMVAQVLARWSAGEKLSAAEIQARIGDGKGAPQQGAGVAVLPLYGIIGHRMNQVQDISGPGGTSTEQFGQWFDAALNDPAIGAIVLDVDSPGGSVSGVPELAAKIFNARGQKPIIAIANSLAASAAYWIASAAEEFWCTPSGDVGSIGVYTLHQDFSAAFQEAGVTNTLVSAGKFKVEGNPYEPLDEEARAALQERIDEYYTEFTKAVALHRGVTASDVRSGFGEGRVVSAVRAKRLGMVDKVATMDTLLGKLGAGGSRSRLKATDLAPSPQLSAGSIDVTTVDEGMVLGYVEAPIDTPDSAITAAIAASGMLDPDHLAARVAAALASQGRADVAAAPVVIPIHGADEAKEFAMSVTGTPVAEAAEQAALAATQEKDRITGLTKLATDQKVPIETLSSWITGTTSVQAAMQSLLDAKKDAREKAPAIRHSVSPLDGGDNGTKAGPFRTIGEQMAAIYQAGIPGGRVDPRLFVVNDMHAAVTGASTAVGSDGGFLVQGEFVTDLMKEAYDEGTLASFCAQREISAGKDRLTVAYIEETSRATGSRWGGVQVYRRKEAETVTNKKPKIGEWELRLEDMMGMCYITGRLDEDAPEMGQVIQEAFTKELAFKLDDEIFRGTGVGECKGVLNADALVTVAKETGQATDTIVFENLNKMWDRVRPRSKARGNWYINPECGSQLRSVTLGLGVAGVAMYTPPGGISGTPYSTLFGRPVIELEQSSALGDVGDICFLDLTQYQLITKGGVRQEQSVHLRFDYDEQALRFLVRVNGGPKLKSAITPYKGSNTLSPFVALAAR